MYRTYSGAIAEEGLGDSHIYCHVHGKRWLNRLLRPYRRCYRHVRRSDVRLKGMLELSRERARRAQQNLYLKRRQLDSWLRRRHAFLNRFNARNIRQIPDQYKSEYRKIQSRVLKYRYAVRNREASLKKWMKHRTDYTNKLKSTARELKKRKLEYMQATNLIARAKKLLDYQQQDLPKKISNFKQRLEKSPHPLAKKVLQFFNEYTQLFNYHDNSRIQTLPPNLIKTNTIESIFARLKPLLHSIRNLSNSKYLDGILQTFRLFHNHSRGIFRGKDARSPI